MASIVKRGKSYSVVYYQGTGKKRQQVWESGLSYSTAKSRKAQIELNGRPIMTEHLNKRFKEILTEMNDPDMNPQEIVFHSLRHTSATTKLLMSGGDYNSVMQAGGWSNLEMLTRRYGKHSFASEREKLAGKMDEFLDGKGINEPPKNNNDKADSAEQILQQLMKSNPELLIEFARSIQNANKE